LGRATELGIRPVLVFFRGEKKYRRNGSSEPSELGRYEAKKQVIELGWHQRMKGLSPAKRCPVVLAKPKLACHQLAAGVLGQLSRLVVRRAPWWGLGRQPLV